MARHAIRRAGSNPVISDGLSNLTRTQNLVRRYIAAAIDHGLLPAPERWGGRGDPGFEPLLSPGMHLLTWQEVRRRVVDAFPRSTTRTALWGSLERFFGQVVGLAVVDQVWLAGSFLSTKPDPGDVDLVAVLRMEPALMLGPEGVVQLEEALDDAKGCHLDVTVTFEWDFVIRTYLQGLLGFCEDRTRARGIAVLPMAGAG